MGSGYFMKEAVFRGLSNLEEAEQKEALEALGVDFLVDNFSLSGGIDDFVTPSKKGAELVQKAMQLEFTKKFGKDYPFSVDIVPVNGKFKVSFFK